MRRYRISPAILSAGLALFVLASCTSTVLAQRAKKTTEIPEPEDLTLETKDGVALRCTWYPGAGKKDTIPIMLIHGWEGQRSEYHSLASGLQELGHAVIVPDLRGHGQSMTRDLPNGDTDTLDPEKFRTRELESMVWDLEACKKFLREKNNAGECNINSLCLVGSEFGCIVALRWAAMDWSAPILPAFKQGQDVRAVVLLTPIQSFKGVTMREATLHPAVKSRISIMIVAGRQDSKGYNEARKLHKTFEAFHPKIDEDDLEEQRKKQDLFLRTPETSLAGTKLLGSGLRVPNDIAVFINLRLVAKQDEFPWLERNTQ
jgi:pimeloyl-ACP methyl ester carboxylesterase